MSAVFKYRELLLTKGVGERWLKPKSKHLQKVSAEFFENLARVDSFCLFPAFAASEALQKQLRRDCAIIKVVGKLSGQSAFDQNTEKAIEREMKLQRSRLNEGERDRKKRMATVGVDYINDLLSHDLGARQAMRGILFSVVVESWMAFENLAANLWFTALDYGQPDWRMRALSKSREFEKGNNWDQFVPVVTHDPSNGFGSALRDAGVISFQKLRLITFWYKTVFGSSVEPIFKRTAGGYLSALSAVRNVIAHSAGNADGMYRDAVKLFPELNRVGLDDPIRLDGAIVRKLSNAAISAGHGLITFVDKAMPAKKP